MSSHFEERLNQRFDLVDHDMVVAAIKKAVNGVRRFGRSLKVSYQDATVVAAPGKKKGKVVLVTCYKHS